MSQDNRDKEILDSDADGLLDEEEKAIGTNPNDPDTDHDGLGDYQEVKVYKTDPLDPDSDCDDIGDGTEIKMGRNPKGKGSLRNLFLPTPCNNYRPHILHPKRLAFHALSAVVIKVIVAAFIFTFPVQAWLSPDILYQQGQKIVELTNQIRINLNLHTLTENESLQRAALAKAENMMVNEYFAHVGPDDRSLRDWLYEAGYPFSTAGENLAIGFSSAEDVVNAWVNSPTHYSNLIDPDFTEIGVGAVSGSYEGHETTLIAQYFGHRVVAVEPVLPEPEPIIEKPIDIEVKSADYSAKIQEASLEIEDEAVEEVEEITNTLPEIANIEETEVLSEQTEAPIALPAPSLNLSKEKTITKENSHVLSIYAPKASLVTVLDGDKPLVIKEKPIDNDIIEVAVELKTGSHHLQIVSANKEQGATSRVYPLIVDKSAPVIDHERTSILVNQPTGQDDIVIKATAYLSDDTNSAEVSFGDYSIILEKDYVEANKWIGTQIISNVDYDDIFNPIVLAALTATDDAGNTLTEDISWQDIKPVQGSVVGQYTFLRQNSSEFIKPLFDLSSIYYKILLIISIIALILNIFVEVRQQRPRTIASTLALILLVSFLTIF